jgi:hypothetical protein
MTLTPNLADFSAARTSVSFPQPIPQAPLLPGGGAWIARGEARAIFQAFSGASSVEASGRVSSYGLDLVGFSAEQRYHTGSFEWLAGFSGYLSSFYLDLRQNGGSFTRFDARSTAGGGYGGVRWPAQSRFSVALRGGYLWHSLPGSWRGSLAPLMAKSVYDFSAPYGQATAQVQF